MSETVLATLTAVQRSRYYYLISLEYLPRTAFVLCKRQTIVRTYL